MYLQTRSPGDGASTSIVRSYRSYCHPCTRTGSKPFIIPVPITGTVFTMIILTLHLRTPTTPFREGLLAVDWFGTLLLVASILLFLLGLDFGGVAHPWTSPIVLNLLVFGALTVPCFFLIEWKVARYPIMPPRIFASTTNVAALLACFLHGLVYIAPPFYLPLYFQSVLGATPLLSGVWLMPFAIASAVGATSAGIYINKTGRYKECIVFGFAVETLGLGLLYDLPRERDWAKIVIYQMLAGLGAGPNFQSPLVALQIHTQRGDNATATAAYNTVRNVATATGIVLGSAIVSNEMAKQKAGLVASLGVQEGGMLAGGAALANVFVVRGLEPAMRSVAEEAYFLSIRKMWILFATLAGVGLIVSGFVQRKVLEANQQEMELGLEEEERKRTTGKEDT